MRIIVNELFPEINLLTYSQSMTRGHDYTMVERVSSTNGAGKTGQLQFKKGN